MYAPYRNLPKFSATSNVRYWITQVRSPCRLADGQGRKADLIWKLKISNAAYNADITQSRRHVTLGIVECRK